MNSKYSKLDLKIVLDAIKKMISKLGLKPPSDIKKCNVSLNLSNPILIPNNISKKLYHSVWVRDDARLAKTKGSKSVSWSLCKPSMYINIYAILLALEMSKEHRGPKCSSVLFASLCKPKLHNNFYDILELILKLIHWWKQRVTKSNLWVPKNFSYDLVKLNHTKNWIARMSSKYYSISFQIYNYFMIYRKQF